MFNEIFFYNVYNIVKNKPAITVTGGWIFFFLCKLSAMHEPPQLEYGALNKPKSSLQGLLAVFSPLMFVFYPVNMESPQNVVAHKTLDYLAYVWK